MNKNIMTIEQIKKYRKKIFEQVHSPKMKFGSGIKGFFNYLLRPVTLFGILLGIIFIIFGIFRGEGYILDWVFGGIGITLFSALTPLIGFGNALVTGSVAYMMASIVSVIWIITKEGTTEELFLFLLNLIPFLIVLIVLYLVSLFLQNKVKCRPVYTVVQKDQFVKITELALLDLIPLQSYPFLAKLQIQPMPDASPRQMMTIHSSLTKYCEKINALLAGTVIDDSENKQMTFYIYIPTEYTQNTITTYAKKFALPISCELIPDENWNVFLTQAMPSEYDIYEVYNRRIYDRLSRERLDPTQDKTLVYVLTFDELQKAQNCANEAKKDGLILSALKGAEIIESNIPYSNIKTYMIILEQKSKLGFERLQLNCTNMIDFAHKFGGRLKNWSIKA